MISRILILAVFLLSFAFLLPLSYAVISELEIDTLVIKAVIKEGNSINQSVTLSNAGGARTIFIEEVSKEPFFYVDDLLTDIEEDESESFTLILGNQELPRGIYSGHIILSDEKENSRIPVILEVESRELIFDAVAEIKPTTADSNLDELEFDISLYNLGFPTKRATLNYSILSLAGDTVSSGQESIDIERQVKITKTLPLDSNLSGEYVLAVYIQQGASVGTSSVIFNYPIFPVSEEDNSSLYLSFFVIIILIVAFLVINYLWKRKSMQDAKNWSSKVDEIRRIKFSSNARKIRKLQYQLNALERAYSAGYIKQNSYHEGRKEINSLINELKKRL